MFPKANVIIILPPWYQWSILLTINVSKRVFISSLSFHMHTIMSYICLNIVNNLNIRFTLFLICFWSQTLSCMCLRIESQCIEVHWICSVLCIYIYIYRRDHNMSPVFTCFILFPYHTHHRNQIFDLFFK